nr:hypothetical protein [Methanobrevibacter sp.]
MQTAKTNAENMLPKLCRAPNSSEDIIIANTVGTIKRNLEIKTPRKTSSSEIEDKITVERNPPTKGRYPITDLEGSEKLIRKSKEGKLVTIKFEKYSIPYEKKIFKKTIKTMYFRLIFENIFFKSSIKLSR